MIYDTYTHILENIPKTFFEIKEDIYNIQSDAGKRVYLGIEKYINEMGHGKYVVSLSGGVDSMVLISVLKYLKQEVIGIHINYNNRQESSEEEMFLLDWCKFNDIKLYVKKIKNTFRHVGNRSLYEKVTKDIRFNYYKEIIEAEECDHVLLGHHKDDIIENIFMNIFKGRFLTNLAVMNKQSKIDGVVIHRPLINLYKNDIFEFAHQNNVPYFKDSTPNWSIRGMYRKVVLPLLKKMFNNSVENNLLNIRNEASEWKELIDTVIIDPFMDSCNFFNKSVEVDISTYKNYPQSFWYNVLMQICHKYNCSAPSKRSVMYFVKYIKEKNKCNFNMNCKYTLQWNKNLLKIIFK